MRTFAGTNRITMYSSLLFFHSLFRWLVLASLLYAICRGAVGWLGNKPFRRPDHTLRHVTATIAHVQLTIGYVLYFSSPLTALFRARFREAVSEPELSFFGLWHILLMTTAVVFVTVGSSLAKRKATDNDRFRTMTVWYSLALAVIVLAIPWPFSPFANRPYFRPF